MTVNRTTSEWEALLGARIRTIRIGANITQDDLARSADVSTGAIRNLERGHGSTVTTLVKVARALGRTDWLEALAPVTTISPLAALAQAKRGEAIHQRQRASRRKPL